MKTKKRILFAVLFLLIVSNVIYNVVDNRRIIVQSQDVFLKRLPEEFDGYSILQISDLHGRCFGDQQSDLLALIRTVKHDCILLTGDMNEYESSDPSSSRAVLELVKGLTGDNPIIWTDGNTGPFAIESIDGACTGQLTDMGDTLTQMGVHVLLSPMEIIRGEQRIWFVPELCEAEIRMNYLSATEEQFGSKEEFEAVTAYGQMLEHWFDDMNGSDAIKIRVNHYPIQANLSYEAWDAMGYPDYDLSIAGHYHGGQIRLPFIGALYIPSPTSGIWNGYFPDQRDVKGLSQIAGTKQYISAGLGASASVVRCSRQSGVAAAVLLRARPPVA